ncbi:gp230 [Sphingomonas phage PAU]|uniref:gp230 n=1 Tax=Sphingomonas phage PAU TaxID=1150991 RepID=UPI0002573384|nr:gp230 [Sphingomonas phage PAU]AFF28228.1 gp230 [Sphingomonas phage PAU]
MKNIKNADILTDYILRTFKELDNIRFTSNYIKGSMTKRTLCDTVQVNDNLEIFTALSGKRLSHVTKLGLVFKDVNTIVKIDINEINSENLSFVIAHLSNRTVSKLMKVITNTKMTESTKCREISNHFVKKYKLHLVDSDGHLCWIKCLHSNTYLNNYHSKCHSNDNVLEKLRKERTSLILELDIVNAKIEMIENKNAILEKLNT